MNEPEYKRIFDMEQTYWWHVSRRRLVRKMLKRYAGPFNREQHYLDVGCGAGSMLKEYGINFEKSHGIDLSYTALGFARKQMKSPISQGDARYLPYPDNHFDCITCLDIIEHVREDLDVIRECYRVCKPGGYLVLSTPALDFLWSEHDESVFHLRRYSWPSLRNRVVRCGFEVVKGTYAVMTMLPVVFLLRFVASFTRSSIEAQGHDFPKPPGWANRLLIAIHDMENVVALRIGLPFGTGIVCIVKKPENIMNPEQRGT